MNITDSHNYYLYAIIDGDIEEQNLPQQGLLDLPLYSYTYQGLALLYSILPPQTALSTATYQSKVSLKEARAWSTFAQHQLLLLQLHTNSKRLLPYPYGLQLPIGYDLKNILGKKHDALLDGLSQASCVAEYHLQLSLEIVKDNPMPSVGGKAHFLKKYQQHQYSEQLRKTAAEVQQILRELMPKSSFSDSSAKNQGLQYTIASTVHQDDSIIAACEQLLSSYPELHLSINGPWPCYKLLTHILAEPKATTYSSSITTDHL